MTAETVLIAAFSGRALAQSARRAGYVPLVADAFGDLDMRDAAHAFEIFPGAMRTGFRAKPLLAALDALVARAPSKPIGLVLGSGFEDKPQLWELLDNRYGILGCNAETVRRCKDPRVFFPLLDELGIAHPETRMQPPENPEVWISKRIGGSGGRHIRMCGPIARATPRRYFQKLIEGERISVSAVSAEGMASDFTKQWCAPTARQPFRYGGCVSLPYRKSNAGDMMLGAASELTRRLRLKGLISFDFIMRDDTPHLLEINPRAGGSLDSVDTFDGGRFEAHLVACRENVLHFPAAVLNSGQRAAAILHADRGPLTLSQFDWPEWAADRGAPGTLIPEGAPLATVLAEAPTSDAAEALARSRLAELESLIYGTSKS